MISQRRRLPFVVATASLALAFACGGAAAPTPTVAPTKAPTAAAVSTPTPGALASPTPRPAASPTAVAAAAPTPTAAAAPTVARTAAKPTGKLTLGMSVLPVTSDPNISFATQDDPLWKSIYDTLLRRNPDGAMVAQLATSWKLTPDGSKLEVDLRQGVKFHSGDPVTAKDVRFSHEYALGDKATGRFRDWFRADIPGLEIVSDYKVLVKKGPAPIYEDALGLFGVLSKDYVEKVGYERQEKRPVGSGPLKFVESVPADRLTLEANEDYWDKDWTPRYKTLVMRSIPEEATRVAALKLGEVDFIDQVSPFLVADIEKVKGLRVESVPRPALHWIYFSNLDPSIPTSKREVRLALNMAIDKKAMAQKIWKGQVFMTEAPLPPYARGWYEPPSYGYDPVKAKKLLADAGYPNGLSIGPIYTYSGVAMIEETMEALRGYWDAIGVKADIKKIDLGLFVARRLRKELVTGLISLPTHGSPDAGRHFQIWFHPKGSISHWNMPTWGQAIDAALAAPTEKERKEKLEYVTKLLNDDVAVITLYSPNNIFAMGENIKQWIKINGASWFEKPELLIPKWAP